MKKILAECLYFEKGKKGFKFCIKLIDKFYYLDATACKTDNRKFPVWILKLNDNNKKVYGFSHVKDVNAVVFKTYLTRKVPYGHFKDYTYNAKEKKFYYIDDFYYDAKILKDIENQANSISTLKNKFISH